MKKKRRTIIIAIIIIALLISGWFVYSYFGDKNRISLFEKEWISNNQSTVINVSVVNDINIFGKDGTGVFFDYLKDFSNEYGFNINTTPYNYGKDYSGLNLGLKNELSEKDILIYRDHYVVVSKDSNPISSVEAISDFKIGTELIYAEQIKKYYPKLNIQTYENRSVLMDELQTSTDMNYIIVPLNTYLDLILSKNYSIVYHISDIPMYYTLTYEEKGDLTTIARKFTNMWLEDKFSKYYNTHSLDLFVLNLGIEEKDKDILTSKNYYYGLIKSPAFEIVSAKSYVGVIGIYLQRFSEFSNVEFEYTNYKNNKSLLKAADNGKLDLYFNYYNVASNFTDIKTNYNPTIAIISPKNNYSVINSISSLRNQVVYTLENSNIYYYLKNLNYVTVKSFANESELMRFKNKNVIIALDKEAYDYYANHGLEKFGLKYTEKINSPFFFKVNGDATFQKLFAKYVNSLDPNELSYEGVNNYISMREKASLLTKIAIYALITIGAGVLVGTLLYKSGKKVKLSKKIKKEDKMRFIDMLTSLKNRNYLSENIGGWNKNNIYPQAAVVVDLNKIKYINDTHGSTEGDKQIKAAANTLIKTQLDNTDIIRTDGNEYLIYMIGYEEKRIVSYIRKLYKEFNDLPYEYGAAVGYSMRTNDMKNIEDVINEATIDMRNKKENKE